MAVQETTAPELSTHRTRIWRIGEWFLVVALLVSSFFTRIASTSFYPDESQWIATSQSFEHFVRGDFSAPIWDDHYFTLTQPPIVRYLIAIGRLAGGYQIADLNLPWDFELDMQTNIQMGTLPSEGLLWWSRLPMALLSALSGLLLFGLTRRAAGRLAAYIFLALYISSSYLATQLGRAMGEASLLFFVSLAALAAERALHSWHTRDQNTPFSFATWRRPFLWFLLVGAFSGLAAATKLNGLAVAGVGVLLCALMLFHPRAGVPHAQRVVWFIRTTAGIFLLASIVFVLVNPYLYKAPITRTVYMFIFRLKEMEYQSSYFHEYHIADLSTRLQIVPQRLLQTCQTFSFPGAWVINTSLLLVGLYALILPAWRTWQRKGPWGAGFVLLLVTLAMTPLVLLTPLDWDRYYLLPVVFSTVFIAIGASQLIFTLHHKLRPDQVSLTQ